MVAVLLASAATFVRPIWRYSGIVVTTIHEGGHLAAALLTHRSVRSIAVRPDGSGLTESLGPERGLGVILTAVAGYVTPSLLGLGTIALVLNDHVALAWLIAGGALAVMLLYARHWFTALVFGLSIAAVAVIFIYGTESVAEFAALTFAWLLLLGGARTTFELWRYRRNSRYRHTDADILARATHVPAVLWNLVFIAVALAAIWGAWVLAVR